MVKTGSNCKKAVNKHDENEQTQTPLMLNSCIIEQTVRKNVKNSSYFMPWAALIHQKTPFRKITPCFILKLKTMNELQSSNNHPYWRPAILVNELCLSAPGSNANLERLF